MIKKIKINIPIWNCKKCMVERKKLLQEYIAKNNDLIDDEIILKFVLCEDNSDDINIMMMLEFKNILDKKFPNKNIQVEIC